MFSDSMKSFSSVSILTAFELISAHSVAFSVNNRLTLSMYLFDDIISLILNEFNSCSSLRSHLDVDIVSFSKKHSQKINVSFCDLFMMIAINLSSQYRELR